MTPIWNLDLNLLLVLDALLQDLNVTRAAQRLGTTQSTLSSSLARLRVALDDPLFVRSQRGLVPTPRALALGKVVREVLGRLTEAIQETDSFEPSTTQARFVLAATDYVQVLLLPPLIRLLHAVAPGVELTVVPIAHQFPWEALAERQVDLVMGGGLGPAGLQSRLLFKDRMVCVLRQHHPAGEGPLDLAAYLALDHVEVRVLDGLTIVDQIMTRNKLERRVVLSVPHFLVGIHSAVETDLCLTLANRIADPLAKSFHMNILPLPFATPDINIRAFWHERVKDDSIHRWLRSMVFRAAETLGA